MSDLTKIIREDEIKEILIVDDTYIYNSMTIIIELNSGIMLVPRSINENSFLYYSQINNTTDFLFGNSEYYKLFSKTMVRHIIQQCKHFMNIEDYPIFSIVGRFKILQTIKF